MANLSKTSRGALMPGLTLGALAFGVIIWLIPMREPVQVAPSIAPVPHKELTEEPEPTLPPEHIIPEQKWLELVASLENLREKMPEPVEPEVNPEELAANSEPEPVAQATFLPPLNWRYCGTITGPGGIAALVAGPNGKRFVFEGQQVPDDADPGAPPILIRSITAEMLMIDRRGKEEEIRFEKTPIVNPLLQRSPWPGAPR